MMVSLCAALFSQRWICDLIESVSGGFPIYSFIFKPSSIVFLLSPDQKRQLDREQSVNASADKIRCYDNDKNAIIYAILLCSVISNVTHTHVYIHIVARMPTLMDHYSCYICENETVA